MLRTVGAAVVAVAAIGITLAAPAIAQDDGTWLVPTEISPGTYRAIDSGAFSGYVAVCADLGCEIDLDGSDATGLIENYIVDGPTYVVVPPFAAAVTTHRVDLVKVGA